jgi:regulator of cell morphogenesis and NO signaling
MTDLIQQIPARNRTVADIAATTPGATAIFRRFNLDFCCGGNVALEDAARRGGIAVADVEKALASLEASEDIAPASRSTTELIDHILARYHAVHRRELPELMELARKVEAVHAEHPRVPRGLHDTLKQILGELEVHMKKEELILFPAMQQCLGGGLDVPIAQMRHDHDDHGEQLRKLESLTDNFTVPADACNSWRALYAGAAKLSDDVREHIHLENNVLFPRFEGPPHA